MDRMQKAYGFSVVVCYGCRICRKHIHEALLRLNLELLQELVGSFAGAHEALHHQLIDLIVYFLQRFQGGKDIHDSVWAGSDCLGLPRTFRTTFSELEEKI